MRTRNLVLPCLLLSLAACASTSRPILEAENAALASDGVSIRYRIAGRDKPEPTIVLVHGFGGDTTIWDEQIDHLSKKHRVLALDLPGHGKSGTDRMGKWTMEAFGDDVRATCDEIGAEKVILVGHSMGGPVILEAAHLMPDRVVALIPVETFHDVEQKMPEDQIKKLLADLKDDYKTNVEQFARKFLFVPSTSQQVQDTVLNHMTALRPDIAASMMSSLLHYDSGKRMEGISVPIRCINSNAIEPTNVDAARKHAKQFEVMTIEGVGHYPMLEAPERFDQLLDAAIAGKPAPKEKKPLPKD